MISLVFSATLLLSGAALAHPDHVEQDLLFHFAAGTHPIQNGAWQDKSHQVLAQVHGAPRLAPAGPTEGLLFTGGQYLSLAQNAEEAQAHLPKRAMSIATWVRLDDTFDRGSIINYLGQADGGRGWALGYTRDAFVFALAAGDNSAPRKLTYLPAKSKIEKGRWYYVVATYDGSVMRLYVNGQLDAESNEQSGDIAYPREAPYVVGARFDRRGNDFMEGSLFELKAYGRALGADEIAAVAKKSENLIAWAPTAEKDLMLVVQPYLQFATQDSITVMCETSKPAKMRVDYAEVQPLDNKAESEGAALINTVKLKGLKTGTRYFYRVTCTDESGAEVRGFLCSFQTAPAVDRAWAFAVIGDTQRNPEVTRKCADGAYSRRPDFLLHCGDVVDDGFAKHQWVKDLFEPCSRLMSHIPTFPVIGNHEKDSHWYYDYFDLPAPEYYYTFSYGNAQFFMIDSNKSLKEGSPQYQWLEKELAASKATWKFTCHHHPCFSSEENDYGDHERGAKSKTFTFGDMNARQLVPLYEKYGVDIAFNGHIHYYERTWPIFEMAINQKKGVRYLTSGGGGGGLESAAPQRTWFNLHFQRAFHYCYAAIHDRTIVFKAYDIDGLLFDTFELTKADDR
jgi:predicted phosphodiesterase